MFNKVYPVCLRGFEVFLVVIASMSLVTLPYCDGYMWTALAMESTLLSPLQYALSAVDVLCGRRPDKIANTAKHLSATAGAGVISLFQVQPLVLLVSTLRFLIRFVFFSLLLGTVGDNEPTLLFALRLVHCGILLHLGFKTAYDAWWFNDGYWIAKFFPCRWVREYMLEANKKIARDRFLKSLGASTETCIKPMIARPSLISMDDNGDDTATGNLDTSSCGKSPFYRTTVTHVPRPPLCMDDDDLDD